MPTLKSHRTWEMSRDMEGHRTYIIEFKVIADPLDGPETVLGTPGLPTVGSTWVVDNDSDLWAFCTPIISIKPHLTDQPNTLWFVRQTFTTKPLNRCQTTTIEDPLDEPDRISGTFVKYTKEATQDRFGNLLKSSSHEIFRGPQVERDYNRPTVRIEQNVADLELDVFTFMIDTLNNATMWGLPAGTIKLSNVPWERKYHGACDVYYTRTLEFDIDPEGFDRDLLDEGTKVLHGDWDRDTGQWVVQDVAGASPDPDNPQHFIRYKDLTGENSRVILDGAGLPANTQVVGSEGSGTTGGPYVHNFQLYSRSNFLLLGVPGSL